MFALPYLFSIFARDTRRTRLVQLVKQFDKHASLGFSVESCSTVQYVSLLDHHDREYKKELLFSQSGVHVFKIEPMITVSSAVLQRFKYITVAKDDIFKEENQLFVVEATSKENINENNVIKYIEQLVNKNNTSVDVLAWMISQSTLKLLATTNIEDYCTLGLGMLDRHLELPVSLQIEQIYSVKYCTSQVQTGRPPNILIYTGDGEESNNKFSKLKDILGQCLDQHKYVIYQLKHDQIETDPWKDNITLLLLATDQEITQHFKETLNEYVQNGGKLLSFSHQYSVGICIKQSGINKEVQDINVLKDLKTSLKSLPVQHVFEGKADGNGVEVLAATARTSEAVIVSVVHGTGLAVMSLLDIFVDGLVKNCERNTLLKVLLNYIGLICNDIQKYALTKAYLLGENEIKKMFLENVDESLVDKCYKGNNIDILFVHDDESTEDVHPSKTFLPLITFAAPEKTSFSFQSYKEHLKTNHLGQLLIYSEVVTSTQTILNGCLKLLKKLPKRYQPTFIGCQQTQGKGRGGNDWLSPLGCLSFSFPVQVDLNSNLGSRLPFLQHMAALAVVEAVRSLKNYEDLDFRIKWPNDIYFGRDIKIGGILVNSSIQGKTFDAVVGIGVNLDNSEPTTCINDVLEKENQLHGKNLRKLSREQLLARIMNCMEDFMSEFQCNGPKNFVTKYHLRWLHSNTKVKLERQNGEEVTVKELDESGFLSVVTSTNEIISLQPDSNSFDMMRNLIAIKTYR